MNKKIFSENLENFYHYYPTTVAIVAVKGRERENLMAAAWHAPLSFKPPLYAIAISPKRYTYKLILEASEFSINFLPQEKREIIAQVGGTKGSEIDKFAKFEIQKGMSIKIKSPILAEAYAAYECKLFNHKTYGDHELMVGEILGVHLNPEAFMEEGLLNLEKVKPALYLGQDWHLKLDLVEKIFLDRKIFTRA